MSLRIGGCSTLLQVFDMPTSVAFYRDVLGFRVVSDVPPDGQCDFVTLELDGTELMLNTAFEAADRPAKRDAARTAAHGDTSLFFGCADVDEAWKLLKGLGLDVAAPVVRDYGMKQVYLKDPDGYEICLQQLLSEQTRD